MPFWKKMIYGFVLANLIAMAVVTFVLPGIIRDQAIEWVATNTDRTLTIANLRLNPLNWQTTIDGLVLTEPGSAQWFASFKRLSFHVSPRSVWERAPVITGLELEGPDISLIRMLDGSFNFSDFLPAEDSAAATPVEEAAGEPPRFALNNLVVSDGKIDFIDQSKPEVTHSIRDFEMALPFLGNTPALADRFVEPHLSMRINDAPIVATGEVKPFAKTLDTSLGLALSNIDLPFYTAYLPNTRLFKVKSGHLSLDLKLAYRVKDGEVPELILSGSAGLSALRVHDQRDKDLFFLPLARINLTRAALFSQEIAISSIDVYDLELFIDRDQDGVWNHARLANDPAFKVAPTNVENEEPQSDSAPPSKVTVDTFRLRDGKVHFLDQAMSGLFKKEIHTINFDLDTISLEAGNVSPFNLSLVIEEGGAERNGQVQVAGDVSLQPFNLTAHLQGEKIQLGGTEVYRPRMLKAYFASGHIDSELDLQLKMVDASPIVNVDGEIGVRGLRVREPVLNSDILAWESLQLSGLKLELASGPPKLHLSEVVLNNYLAKVLVTREGKVNLQHAVAQAEASSDEKAVVVEPEEPVATTTSDQAPQISIDTIILQDGTFSFADEHMKKPFRSKLTKLGGRISGLDSTAGKPAEVDLRGSLNDVSPLKITGGLNPFGDALFADFKIRFDAIDLTQVTPYSGTYLGYTIRKGKLYLDLDYKIDGAQLDASNKVFLDQFTFGDSVESDKATGLPVKLAIALLKDRQGEIHLDLPVTGSLDDPQFSIVGVTFTIIKNLLVKAITSPFALLASLVGGGGEDFSAVYFALGSAELSLAEQDKLSKLAAALQERPGLQVEVSGYIDAENDPEGFRRVDMERRIRVAAGKPSVVELTDKERGRALKKVYKKADFPKPRNALGFVKGLPDVEMEKLILANTTADEADMQQLAQLRAKQVVDNLIQVQGLPPKRVFLKLDDIYKQGDAETKQLARAGFGVAVN